MAIDQYQLDRGGTREIESSLQQLQLTRMVNQSSHRLRDLMRFLIVIPVICFLNVTCTDGEIEFHDSKYDEYTNEWATRIRGGPQMADIVAKLYSCENRGPLIGIKDTYLFRCSNIPKRSLSVANGMTEDLNNLFLVEFADQQKILQRDKRVLIPDLLEMIWQKVDFTLQCVSHRFNDPVWQKQWYMCNDRSPENKEAINLHVDGAWDSGVTGKGIVVTILDDGIEWNNTDISANYDPDASWDVNGQDPDPSPRYEEMNINSHGTRCAAEVAMIANNNVCGVGVAYNAKIGGVRLLDGPITDYMEAIALGFNCTHVDIYSASWGPPDNGESLDGPKRLASEAMRRCIREGRRGKGVIYVWASGNGGIHGDNCNCDGYASSIYSVSIGGVEPNGGFPYFGEQCASTIACTFSGGIIRGNQIMTADLHNKCTGGHVGTSAAAPLGAGIVALILEANPNLTWRDVQHIITWTANTSSLSRNPGWHTNGVGLKYNPRFGFGLLHAERAVVLAKKWVNVPSGKTCKVFTKESPLISLRKSSTSVTFDATRCTGIEIIHVNYMEHVQLEVDIEYTRRGALEIELISPQGTRTTLLTARPKDNASTGFQKWKFMSRHLWGESPNGQWKLIITDSTNERNNGYLHDAVLFIHGTSTKPAHMKEIPSRKTWSN